MANSTSSSAGSSAPGTSAFPAQSQAVPPPVIPQAAAAPPVSLLEKMAGWHSTQQVADLLGCSKRQFQDFANRRKLSKKKVELSAFSAPDVAGKAQCDWQKIQAAKDAPKPRLAQRRTMARQAAAEGEAFSGPSAGDDAFYNQVLALIGQIVQHGAGCGGKPSQRKPPAQCPRPLCHAPCDEVHERGVTRFTPRRLFPVYNAPSSPSRCRPASMWIPSLSSC